MYNVHNIFCNIFRKKKKYICFYRPLNKNLPQNTPKMWGSSVTIIISDVKTNVGVRNSVTDFNLFKLYRLKTFMSRASTKVLSSVGTMIVNCLTTYVLVC